MPNFSKLLLLTATCITLSARSMEGDHAALFQQMREHPDIGMRLQAAQTILDTLDPMTMMPHQVELLNQIFQALGQDRDPAAVPGMNDLLFAAATRMLGAANLDVQFAAAQALVPHLETLDPMALAQLQRIAGERALGPDASFRIAIAIVNHPMPDFPPDVQQAAAQTILEDPTAHPIERRRAAEIVLDTLDPMTMMPHQVELLNQIFQALGQDRDPAAVPGMNDLLFAAATRMLGAANLDVQFAAAQALVPHLETLNPMALVQMHRIAGERALGPDVQLRLATAIVNYPMPPDLDLPAAFEHYPRPNPDFPLEVQRGAAQTLLQDQGVNPDQQRRAVEVMFNALDPALRIIPEEVPGLHLALQALTRPGVLQPGDPLLVRGVAVMEELRTAHPPVDPETQVTLAVAAINHPDMAPPNGMTPDLLRAVAQIIFDHPEGVAENVFQRAQQILNPQ